MGKELGMEGSKRWLRAFVAFLVFDITFGQIGITGPPNVQTWCGKPYENTNSSLDPGGQFQFPSYQTEPLLYITFQPRYSIFLSNDNEGSFIVNAEISHFFGQSFTNASGNTAEDNGKPFNSLSFKITDDEKGVPLVADTIAINTTGATFSFSLSSLEPRLNPYPITLTGSSPDGQHTYKASTELYVLPPRNYGSAVKIDNLYGGLYVQNPSNHYKSWYSIFPNGYYGDGSYLTPSTTNLTNLKTYSEQGFNTLNIVPNAGLPDQSYPTESLAEYWNEMDALNLFNIYDMRFAFQNSTRISEQVALWQNRSTLLMWYTADEPDGWAYPLNSTLLAYNQIKELDPYHPVSLVLNCQNYYYTDYSSGADIVFEDAYPIAINATWSIPWSTPCNTTYGDCGCDNCVGSLTDVSTRLDDLETYQSDIPYAFKKPNWSVLQAFGSQDYWSRLPTEEEVVNMMVLSINHGAKGITYWIYPSTDDVNVASGGLGKVLGAEPAIDFLFGTEPVKGLKVEGKESVDASAWLLGDKILIGVANGQSAGSGEMKISMPDGVEVSGIDQVLYGDNSWKLDGDQLVNGNMAGLDLLSLTGTS